MAPAQPSTSSNLLLRKRIDTGRRRSGQLGAVKRTGGGDENAAPLGARAMGLASAPCMALGPHPAGRDLLHPPTLPLQQHTARPASPAQRRRAPSSRPARQRALPAQQQTTGKPPQPRGSSGC